MRRDPGDLRPAGDPPDGGGDPGAGSPGPLAPTQPAAAHALCQQRPYRPLGEAEEAMNIP